jgi:hypothetical protein
MLPNCSAGKMDNRSVGPWCYVLTAGASFLVQQIKFYTAGETGCCWVMQWIAPKPQIKSPQ